MFQEEINKNQKGGNNNRDSGLFGLDVPPKPEVGNRCKIITIVNVQKTLIFICIAIAKIILDNYMFKAGRFDLR